MGNRRRAGLSIFAKDHPLTGNLTASPWPAAYLFDLDGTLVDSLPDLAEALDELLAEDGFAPLGAETVRGMIGHGVEKLVQRGLAARGVVYADAGLAEAVDRFRSLYEPRAARLTRLYPGVEPVIAALRAGRVPMAVCTNKPEAPSHVILDQLGLTGWFGAVIGGDHGPPKKPAPDLVLAAAAALGVAPRDCLFVGDSGADVGAARAAGVPVVVVRYGYTSVPAAELGADAVIDDFGGLAGVVADLAGRLTEPAR
ncbi:phosphoglycolate phosphatase [Methylobrevis sp. L22]|uniref:Phosphoglycolate phosphatase n=1 Tax=Methylobrevis albus TaxID=2793297 RepID=A0A931I0L8_9HYPH|nr:phosphoglycolate phosphatase [Methylobrevis albus]